MAKGKKIPQKETDLVIEKDNSPVYDAKQDYQWKADESFILTGLQFNKLYADLRKLAFTAGIGLSSVEIVENYQILQSLLEEGVSSGKVFPMPPQQSN